MKPGGKSGKGKPKTPPPSKSDDKKVDSKPSEDASPKDKDVAVKDSPATEKSNSNAVLPAWVTLNTVKGETIEDVTEAQTSGMGMAVAAAVFALLAGLAGFFKAQIAAMVAGSATKTAESAAMSTGDMVVIGLVVIIAIIAFVVLMIMGKGKIALIMTSIRSICAVGKKQLEIKK
jgi:hypothetical protein